MEGTERDRTEDWLIPAASAPPTLSQLECRIDEALAIARSAEAAVVVIGDAALDAADQANRAAGAAERASAAALEAKRAVLGGGEEAETAPTVRESEGSPPRRESLQDFSERADRLTARLLALAPPAPDPGASAAAGSRQAVG